MIRSRSMSGPKRIEVRKWTIDMRTACTSEHALDRIRHQPDRNIRRRGVHRVPFIRLRGRAIQIQRAGSEIPRWVGNKLPSAGPRGAAAYSKICAMPIEIEPRVGGRLRSRRVGLLVLALQAAHHRRSRRWFRPWRRPAGELAAQSLAPVSVWNKRDPRAGPAMILSGIKVNCLCAYENRTSGD